MSWVWYSRMAPRMWGRTKSALKREKMRNISLAFLAVPNWSLNLDLSMRWNFDRRKWLLDYVHDKKYVSKSTKSDLEVILASTRSMRSS